MLRLLIAVSTLSLAAASAHAQQGPLNPSTPAGRLAIAGGAAPGTKVAPTPAPAVAKPATSAGRAPAAKAPEHLTTAVTTKAVGKAKAPIKCADGQRVKPGANACGGRRGVDTATLAAEAQPGEVTAPPPGAAPITNALPSGELKAR
jgi:hypothetical protein